MPLKTSNLVQIPIVRYGKKSKNKLQQIFVFDKSCKEFHKVSKPHGNEVTYIDNK